MKVTKNVLKFKIKNESNKKCMKIKIKNESKKNV